MKLRCSLLFLVCAVMLSGCGQQPEAEATPSSVPTSAPQPTPSPVLALGVRKQGIVFHDLTQSEQVCPGFAEIIGPIEVSPEQITHDSLGVVRQVRVVCTNDEKGTVYFVDVQNQTITVTRKLAPVPGMP